MSACCSSYGDVAGAQFDETIARRELQSYRKNGPGPTARLLRDLIVDTGGIDGSLLDVGSGIGGLTFELLDRGITRAIAVDASAPYLAAAAQEATRRDRLRVVEFVHGDFLEVASRVPKATVVTLDRVICCYPSYETLLDESLRHTERVLAFSYPKDAWYVAAAVGLENRARWLKRNPFRAFVHPVDQMTRIVERAGLRLVGRRQTWQWSADVWTRS
ncbi:MAG TPA: class I SAM-dependent methyltransferase [Vicinamibacterales bacterium]|nr:class I SAM-dependent methyltransferase [Vicinamibacterales bacterium]